MSSPYTRPSLEAIHPKLVGRSVTISVGEPWNFVSEAGRGILKGRVVEISDAHAPAPEQWVLCEVSPFEAGDGKMADVVAGTLRHRSEEPLFEQLLGRGRASVNLAYEPDGNFRSEDGGSDRARLNGIRHEDLAFLIGSVQLVGDL